MGFVLKGAARGRGRVGGGFLLPDPGGLAQTLTTAQAKAMKVADVLSLWTTIVQQRK